MPSPVLRLPKLPVLWHYDAALGAWLPVLQRDLYCWVPGAFSA